MKRIAAFLFLVCVPIQAEAVPLGELATSLKGGGYVIVFRHGATDDSQRDVYPFKFDDMSSQRQLNEQGRIVAREIGVALRKLSIPIGTVYTSRLNRAVETGKLIAGKEVTPVDALTDSSGKNAKAGRAVREIVDAAPKPGTNNLAVTHKTNVTDAFGMEFADIREGEALVYRTNASGPAVFVRRGPAGRRRRSIRAAGSGVRAQQTHIFIHPSLPAASEAGRATSLIARRG